MIIYEKICKVNENPGKSGFMITYKSSLISYLENIELQIIRPSAAYKIGWSGD